jgi:hypothetical protein
VTEAGRVEFSELKAIETGAGDAARVLDDIDPGLFSNFAQARSRRKIEGGLQAKGATHSTPPG